MHLKISNFPVNTLAEHLHSIGKNMTEALTYDSDSDKQFTSNNSDQEPTRNLSEYNDNSVSTR
jgi:hypothetical protein